MSEFKTLLKCFSQIEAHQIKNKLDNEGIFCQIINETASQVYNFHPPSDGGILIKVHKNDFNQARQYLDTDVRLDIIAENSWDKPGKSDENLELSPKANDTSKRTRILYFILIVIIVITILALIIPR